MGANCRKNLVSTRFNFFIWMTELISGAMVLIPGRIFKVVYFFVPNFVSPIFYYVGIESKRNAIKGFFQLSKKSKVSQVEIKIDSKVEEEPNEVLTRM